MRKTAWLGLGKGGVALEGKEAGSAGSGGPAERSADRLAVALEDVGFDVGQEFPGLRGGVDERGRPAVVLGVVEVVTADQLSAVLMSVGGPGAPGSGPGVPGEQVRHVLGGNG